jgi:hypothetical protein
LYRATCRKERCEDLIDIHFSAPGHLLQFFGVTIPLNRDFRSGSVDFKQNSAAMLARAR